VVTVGVVALLLATSGGYDYHRDELYFRMLRPDWGYVDQPPFTPLLIRASTTVLGDSVWALRAPFVLIIAVVAVVAALVAREVGGRTAAQVVAAAGAGGMGPLLSGHLGATTGPDLLAWTLVGLFVLRALLREQGRWWLWAGLVAGLGLYNKHLVLLLLGGLGAGLLLAGPRRELLSRALWAGVGIAVLVGLPNLLYQVVNDFPQAQMAAALADDRGDEVRPLVVPLQFVLLGTFAVPVVVAGFIEAWRDRRMRAFVVAYPVVLALTVAGSGQFYYTLGILLVVYAIGAAPVERWMADRRGRVLAVTALLAVNTLISAVFALPLIPIGEVGSTPVAAANQTVGDQIGWRRYVRQIAAVHAALPTDDRDRTVIITANYGEAGAIDRYGPAYGLPDVYSGHNALHAYGPPPESATVVIVVTAGDPMRTGTFGSCTVEAELDNAVDVDNEEQGATVSVCRDRRMPWTAAWPKFKHLD
jgi:4-amino-4-deoxy-L-arabinose transferase-like glycosyltransferase